MNIKSITILGTIHGAHNTNKKYTKNDLKRIITNLKPDVILMEATSKMIDENDNFESNLIDLYGENYPDGVAVNEVAKELNLIIVPIDWEERDDFYEKTNFSNREYSLMEKSVEFKNYIFNNHGSSLYSNIIELDTRAENSAMDMMMNFDAKTINSNFFDNIIAMNHSFSTEIIPKISKMFEDYLDFSDELTFFADAWHKRNIIMIDNILEILNKNEFDNYLIIVGCEHRGLIVDKLKRLTNAKLREFWEIV
ncbi:MAG: hypothetical protein JW870_17615 [Candidatus Delongbacteria bacterium]|nr:hypothetical protein [Candidatus Delongbacteria bacterium]